MAVPGGEYKFAKKLNREDVIVTFDFETQQQLEEKIESILIEPVEGYSAPLTMSGNLLVDGILTSSYAIIDSQSLAHTVMAPVRWWYSVYNMASPRSMTNLVQIEKQLNGTHWYPGLLHTFTEQYLNKFVKFH